MATNWSRFTQEAKEALGQSTVYALQGGHQSNIKPIHVFLALLDQPNCEASLLLSYAGLSLKELKTELLKILPKSTDTDTKSEDLNLISLSPEIKRVLEYAVAEAQNNGNHYVNTRSLLTAMLRQKSEVQQSLEKRGFTRDKIHSLPQLKQEAHDSQPPTPVKRSKYRTFVSPIFLLLLIVMILTGILIYNGHTWQNLAVFVFVLSGWVISLALHEFGHAITAYFSGDFSVAQKGYLTLNPLKYTHGLRSIVYPIILMIAGGIGLPGGAVYINRDAISSQVRQSLVSISGPLATLSFTALISIPFLLNWHQTDKFINHYEFWAAFSLLLYLQVTALLFNILPIPGFDGFNFFRPWLPDSIITFTDSIGRYTFFIILVIFYLNNPLRDAFWASIDWLTMTINLNINWVHIGYRLFRFWET